MRRLFLMLALLTLTLGGCGNQIDWFPDATTGVTVAAFSFTPLTNVQTGQVQSSEEITVALSGGTSAPISVSNGQYIVNSGTPTSAAGTVKNGDKVKVQHTSATSGSTTVTTTLTIGGRTATFTSTTGVSVAAFTLDQRHNVDPGSKQTSTMFTVSIPSGGTAKISVTGGLYQKTGGSLTSVDGTVSNGDEVVVQHNAAAAGATDPVVSTTLTIGDKSATFTTTTGDVVPLTIDVNGDVKVGFVYPQIKLSLKTGTYDVTVVDSTNTAGFTLTPATPIDKSDFAGGEVPGLSLTDGGTFAMMAAVPEKVGDVYTILYKIGTVPITLKVHSVASGS